MALTSTQTDIQQKRRLPRPKRWSNGVENAITNLRNFEKELKAFVPGSLCIPPRVGGVGPLSGAAFAVKDNLSVKGYPTAAGSQIPVDETAAEDSAIVETLLHLGGAFIGKTSMAEFALFQAPATLNPKAPKRTPGGSSTGSAVAVAAGMTTFAIGTQTAGSVIRPAAYCGIAGYKPTFDRISTSGLQLLAPSLDTIGFFAQGVDDLAYLAKALLPAKPHKNVRLGNVRIGLIERWADLEPERSIRFALKAFGEEATAVGANVITTTLPAIFDAAHYSHRTVMAFEACRSLADVFASHRSEMSRKLVDFILEGQQISRGEYAAAVRSAYDAKVEIANIFEDFDILIAPSSLGVPPLRRVGTGSSAMNRLWTLLGVPCVNVPVPRSRRFLPLGLQVIAACDFDHVALKIASEIQAMSSRRFREKID